jgi:predicted nucleotidyltransferase component of viral defense system
MIPGAMLLEWRNDHPWADMAQVEQDLILSRALVEIFQNPFLAEHLAFRGGTALHKLFLPEPLRYSEDLDFVQIRPGAIGPLFDALRSSLEPWMGKAQRKQGPGVVSFIHKVQSESPDGRMLRIKVEINTREHFVILGHQTKAFTVTSAWFTGTANVPTFCLDELMGSKLRALYQRQKSRDLFDLWLALQDGKMDPRKVVRCFQKFIAFQGVKISTAEFQQNLDAKLARPDFLSDLQALIRADVSFDPKEAARLVRKELLNRLDEPVTGSEV